jgi:hypothetical protein
MMAIATEKQAKPNSTSASPRLPISRYRTPAPRSSANIGSRTTSTTMRSPLRRSNCGSAFGPSVRSRSAASRAVRPAWLPALIFGGGR